MNVKTRNATIDGVIAADAQILSKQLQRLREQIFAPESKKVLRRFTSGETARLIGISDSYLRQLSLAKEGPSPDVGPGGRRQYTLGQVNALRRHLATTSQSDKIKHHLPHRTSDEHLQILAVTNFKGGSRSTPNSIQLSPHPALCRHRVPGLRPH